MCTLCNDAINGLSAKNLASPASLPVSERVFFVSVYSICIMFASLPVGMLVSRRRRQRVEAAHSTFSASARAMAKVHSFVM